MPVLYFLRHGETDFNVAQRLQGRSETHLNDRGRRQAQEYCGVLRDLLAREADGTHFRLIGIAGSDLLPAAQGDRGDLIDTEVAREKATETAIDTLRARFGRDAVVRGMVFRGADKPRN